MSDITYTYSGHTIRRMAERNVSRDDVESVIETGEVIREYPDDKPYESRLILGWRGDRPLHVVAADNEADNEIIIITVYEPDPNIWNKDFRSKKP